MSLRLLTPGQAMGLLPGVPPELLAIFPSDALPEIDKRAIDNYLTADYTYELPQNPPESAIDYRLDVSGDSPTKVEYAFHLHDDPLIRGAQVLLISDADGLTSNNDQVLSADWLDTINDKLFTGARHFLEFANLSDKQAHRIERFIVRSSRGLAAIQDKSQVKLSDLPQVGAYAASLYHAQLTITDKMGLFDFTGSDPFAVIRFVQSFIKSISQQFPESPTLSNLKAFGEHLGFNPFELADVMLAIYIDLTSQNPFARRFKNVSHYASYLLWRHYFDIAGVMPVTWAQRLIFSLSLKSNKASLPNLDLSMFSTLPKDIIEPVLALHGKAGRILLHALFIDHPQEFVAFDRHLRAIGLKEGLGKELGVMRDRSFSNPERTAFSLWGAGLLSTRVIDYFNSCNNFVSFEEEDWSRMSYTMASRFAMASIVLFIGGRNTVQRGSSLDKSTFLKVRNPSIVPGAIAYGYGLISALDNYLLGLSTQIPWEFLLIPIGLLPAWLLASHSAILNRERLLSSRLGTYYDLFLKRTSRYWPTIMSTNKKSLKDDSQSDQNKEKSEDERH